MATQSNGDGSTVEFGNAPKAQADVYVTTEDAAGVDGTSIILLNVTGNDSMSGGKTLYSVDDGRLSYHSPAPGGDADLLTKDTVYADATVADLLTADSSSNDTSFLGAKIWITADGKVAYDTSSPAIEALAQGQTATDSFVYAIRSGNELYWTTVTLTITGANDAPVLSANATLPPIPANPISGSAAPRGETAILGFTDVDLLDTHTAGIRYVGATLSGGQALPSGLDAILAADATAVLEADSTNNGTGVIAVPFSSASSAFDFLGQGQTLTVAYAVTVTDNWGASSTLPVTFTITGTNHTPALSAPWTTAPAIVEAADTTGSTAMDASSVTLAFTDVDLADTHAVSLSYVGASWQYGCPLPSGLDSVLASAAQAALAHDSTNGAAGAVNVSFSAPDGAFDFLGQGQTLTVGYAVAVTDNSGAIGSEMVYFTITGTDDAPILSADAGGPHAFTEGAPSTWGQDFFTTTLAFTDPDLLYDFHSASVGAPTFAWSGPGAPATLSTAELNALHAAFDGAAYAYVTADGGSGGVTAQFSVPDSALGFLGAGQTLTVTYGVAVSDLSGGVSNVQPLTITLTGINEAPQIYGYGRPIYGPGGYFFVYFTDADFTDTHTASLSYTGAQWSTGGLLPSDVALSLASAATATLTQDSTDGASGSVTIAINPADPRFAFLAAGEYLALNYNLTIDDGHGGTVVDPETIYAVGTNDAVVLDDDPAASHTVSRQQSTPDSASASLAFADLDLNDIHGVALSGPIFSGDGISNLPYNLATELAGAATWQLHDSAGTGSGSIDIQFSAPDSAFDFLTADQTLTIAYNVTVNDGSTYSSQQVRFTVTGTNHAPVLLADTSGPHPLTGFVIPGGGLSPVSGYFSLTFSDFDLNDHHTATVGTPILSTSTGQDLPATVIAALSAPNVVATTVTDSGFGFGRVDGSLITPASTFAFLAYGETLTATYSITVSDGHGGSSTQPVTFVFTGPDHAPQITSVQGGAITELANSTGDTTPDTATASVLFTDTELNDTHANPTLTFAYASGPHVTPALQAALASAAQAYLVQDSTGGGAGQINVTFSAPDSTFDFLAPSEQLTVNYNLTVTDSHGGSTTKLVTFTITGSGDPEVMNPDTGPHLLTEQAGVTNSPAIDSATATLTFIEPDLDSFRIATPTGPPTIIWSGGSVAPKAVAWSLSFAPHLPSVLGSPAEDIKLSFADNQVDFLAQGETLTISDVVTLPAAYGGAAASQTITFVVTGTNDAPVLAADAVGPHAVSGGPSGVTGQSTPDTGVAVLRFTDVDFNDTHTVSVGPAAAVLSSGGALPDGLQDLLNAAVQTSLGDTTHLGAQLGPFLNNANLGIDFGTIGVSFSAADSAFDFLGAGQTLTVTYNVTVTDNHGLSSTQAVTFTIDGANYAPLFASSAPETLTGTATADEFVFGGPTGVDAIAAFDPAQDVIDLIGFAGFSSFADVQAHTADDVGGDAVITLASGETITLTGVSTASLSAADFQFNRTPPVFNTGTMSIADGASHLLGGGVVNSGTIALGSTGDATVLDIAAIGATLSGGGQVTLSDSGQNAIAGAVAGAVLTNADNTISGAGQIGAGSLNLVNQGTIDANGTNALVIDTGSHTVVNSGRIEATGPGGLTVNSALNNSGYLVANGGDLHLMGPVTGSGLAIIAGSSTIEFGAASSEAVKFDISGGTLKLDDPTHFTGRISGFLPQDHIDLVGIAPSATMSITTNANNHTSVLTVNDGIHVASLAFDSLFLPTSIHLSSDQLGGSLVGFVL